MTGSRLLYAAGIAVLTLLSFFVFPGHTYLAWDTQFYVPMLERLHDPALFQADIMASRPHLAYTVYDEITLALTDYSPLNLEQALKLQQLIFRGLGIGGVFLIGLALGLDAIGAWFVAAVYSLGIVGDGSGVTVEMEPIPRAFAIGLVPFAIGLAAWKRSWAAGTVGGLALLYHPSTALAFWLVVMIAVAMRQASWKLLAPLAPAALLLVILAHFQSGVTESVQLFGKLDPFREEFLRVQLPPIFVSEWTAKTLLQLGGACVFVAIAVWRLWGRLNGPLRAFFVGLPLAGVLSIPVSWMLLEGLHLALVPPWRPPTAALYIELIAGILATARGILAVHERRWLEAVAWMIIAFVLPLKGQVISWFVNPALPLVVAGLAAVACLAAFYASRMRGATLALAGLLPFVAMANPRLVAKPAVAETRELDDVAQWARVHTTEDAVFLFPDVGMRPVSGIFRALSERAIYVDYRSRGQAVYFPVFAVEWSRRWRGVHEERWEPSAEALREMFEMHVDYAVVATQDAIPRRAEEYRNAEFVVYRALP